MVRPLGSRAPAERSVKLVRLLSPLLTLSLLGAGGWYGYDRYIAPEAAPLPLDACAVVDVSPLLRNLIEALTEGRGERRHRLVMDLVLEEVRIAPPLSLGLPLPRDRRLKVLCDRLMADPAEIDRILGDGADRADAAAAPAAA